LIGDRELMRIHIETLFALDSRGRMVRVNEPGGAVAPRFFIGRTASGKVWRFRDDLDRELTQALDACARDEAGGDEMLRPPYGSTPYEDRLARAAPVEHVWAGPAYRCPDDLRPTADTVVVTGENLDILRPHFTAWLGDVEHCQPFVALVEHGQAVSVCASVRATEMADEAGVETHPESRGRGYAAQVVAAWAAAVCETGRIPLYSTSWQNTASQAVAAKLGLVRFGTDLHIT
jgi:hypothetical protein